MTEKTVVLAPDLRRKEFMEQVQLLEKLSTDQSREFLGDELAQQIREAHSNIQTCLSRPFKIVVLGDFKRGKSTLVNALISQSILPTNIAPETISFNRIVYGEIPKITGYLQDGRQLDLSPDELKAETLTRIAQTAPLESVSISYPFDWLNDIELVDTPGLGDLVAQNDKRVENYIKNADVVVYVISALSPLSETERNFLKRAIAPLDYAKVIFVVNMIDLLKETEQIQRVAESLRAKIHMMFPGAPVFAVSARDECARQVNSPRPAPQLAHICESNFHEFRTYLHESILAFRELMQFERAVFLAHDALQHIQNQASFMRQATAGQRETMLASAQNLKNQLASLETSKKQEMAHVENALSTMQVQTGEWMSDYLTRLNQEINTQLITYEFDDVRKHYIFYLNDMLTIGLNQCLAFQRSQIAQMLEIKNPATIQEKFPSIGMDASAIGFQADAWGTFQTAQYSLLYLMDNYLAPITGFSISQALVGGVNTIFNKKASDPRKLLDYQELLTQNIPALSQLTNEHIHFWYTNAYTDIAKALESKYLTQANTLQAMLSQIQKCLEQDDEKLSQTALVLGQVVEQTQTAIEKLDDLQEKMWPTTLNFESEGDEIV